MRLTRALFGRAAFCGANVPTTIPSLALLLGELHRLMAKFSFDLRLEYVKSKDNVAADALSRLDFDTFFTFMTSKGYDPAGGRGPLM